MNLHFGDYSINFRPKEKTFSNAKGNSQTCNQLVYPMRNDFSQQLSVLGRNVAVSFLFSLSDMLTKICRWVHIIFRLNTTVMKLG